MDESRNAMHAMQKEFSGNRWRRKSHATASRTLVSARSKRRFQLNRYNATVRSTSTPEWLLIKRDATRMEPTRCCIYSKADVARDCQAASSSQPVLNFTRGMGLIPPCRFFGISSPGSCVRRSRLAALQVRRCVSQNLHRRPRWHLIRLHRIPVVVLVASAHLTFGDSLGISLHMYWRSVSSVVPCWSRSNTGEVIYKTVLCFSEVQTLAGSLPPSLYSLKLSC